jgi:hypothetical protein
MDLSESGKPLTDAIDSPHIHTDASCDCCMLGKMPLGLFEMARLREERKKRLAEERRGSVEGSVMEIGVNK